MRFKEVNPKNKSVFMWIQKLESMQEILLSDGHKELENLDKYEVQFLKLRDQQQAFKSLIEARREKLDAGVHLDKEMVMLKNKLEKLNEELLDDYHLLANIFKT